MFKKKHLPYLMSVGIFFGTLFLLIYQYEDYLKERTILGRGGDKLIFFNKGDNPDGRYELGYPPHTKVLIKKFIEGKMAFQAYYEFDQYGLRVQKMRDINRAKEHLIFTGCSFTFGVGVQGDETFSQLIEDKYRDLNTYNISFGGGGIHTSLRFTELHDLRDVIKEEGGRMIYVMIENHISRWLSSSDYLSWAPSKFPYYEAHDGKVVYKGHVSASQKYKNYKMFKQQGLEHTALRVSQIANNRSEEDLESYVRGVAELKRRYLEKFPEGKFLLMYHPLSRFTPLGLKKLNQVLDRFGIDHFDSSPYFLNELQEKKLSSDDFHIPRDQHPNPLLHERIVKYLEAGNILKTADRNGK